MQVPQHIRKDVARALLEIGAVAVNFKEQFTLTSGLKSPVYVDCRKIISYPEIRSRLVGYAAEVLAEGEPFDVVAGGETAGIPFAAFIAERRNIPMVYVRKKPKGFGKMAQIEGDLQEGQRVLLVEDLASQGTSKQVFFKALREAGATAQYCLVFFNYGVFPGAMAELAYHHDIHIQGLATWQDIIDVMREDEILPVEDIKKVEAFLQEMEKATLPAA